MNYRKLTNSEDCDIPQILSVMRLPEVSRYLSIDEQNYWKYVTTAEDVFFFKVYDRDRLVATTHCEVADGTLYMDILVFPAFQRQGIAAAILSDIQNRVLPLSFDRIEVSIDETNIPSIRLFEKMGFSFASKEDELLNYVYEQSFRP